MCDHPKLTCSCDLWNQFVAYHKWVARDTRGSHSSDWWKLRSFFLCVCTTYDLAIMCNGIFSQRIKSWTIPNNFNTNFFPLRTNNSNIIIVSNTKNQKTINMSQIGKPSRLLRLSLKVLLVGKYKKKACSRTYSVDSQRAFTMDGLRSTKLWTHWSPAVVPKLSHCHTWARWCVLSATMSYP